MRATPRQSAAILLGGTAVFAFWETYRGNPKFYSNVVMPTVHRVISAESAHYLAVKVLASKYYPRSKFSDPDILKSQVWGREFKNPLGIAAGFDKHAEAMGGLENMGFGFVEIGSVTPEPQEGNPQPRVFRLSKDEAVINRYGFNSCGHKVAAERLSEWRKKETSIILGVNLGKNKTSDNHIGDYKKGVTELGKFADYIVINVSSPNTPGLRKLQTKSLLKDLVVEVKREINNLHIRPLPVMLVKLSPDLSEEDVKDISEIALDKECGIDGLIISNTTVQRPLSLKSKNSSEIGGLSGPPLRESSTELIRIMYSLTQGKVPIIGVGGISSGEDAYQKIRAGATLVQIYTSLVYHGPPIVTKIKSELCEILEKEKFSNVADAVGADHLRRISS